MKRFILLLLVFTSTVLYAANTRTIFEQTIFTDTTSSTSSTTGAVQIRGGLGVVGRGTLGSLSVPGAGSNSQNYGPSSSAATDALAIGTNAVATNGFDFAIGNNATATGAGFGINFASLAVGNSAMANGFVDLMFGNNSSNAGLSCTGVGNGITIGSGGSSGTYIGFAASGNAATQNIVGASSNGSTFTNVSILGSGITASANGQTIIGDTSTEIIFGMPSQTGAIAAKTFRFSERTGSNAAGADVTWDIAARGTGTGTVGVATFNTWLAAASGTTQHTLLERERFAAAETVVNETGADLDFRVEGDTRANLLFADAGLDRVGIDNASPTQKLDVGNSGNVRIDGLTASTMVSANSSKVLTSIADGSNGQFLRTNGSGTYSFAAAPTGAFNLQPWQELANAALLDVGFSSTYIYGFDAGLGQQLYSYFKVPNGYTAGTQINLRLLVVSSDTTGNILLSSQATLIRTGTDTLSSTTNQRTSTNTAITLSGATQNIPQAVTLDLTAAAGTINSVAVAAGNLIKVRIFRGTDTSTSIFYEITGSEEVTNP